LIAHNVYYVKCWIAWIRRAGTRLAACRVSLNHVTSPGNHVIPFNHVTFAQDWWLGAAQRATKLTISTSDRTVVLFWGLKEVLNHVTALTMSPP
jgi:hypothetical protein